jgi:K+/H+ antiporter YhaU regulatory subunit KhtT
VQGFLPPGLPFERSEYDALFASLDRHRQSWFRRAFQGLELTDKFREQVAEVRVLDAPIIDVVWSNSVVYLALESGDFLTGRVTFVPPFVPSLGEAIFPIVFVLTCRIDGLLGFVHNAGLFALAGNEVYEIRGRTPALLFIAEGAEIVGIVPGDPYYILDSRGSVSAKSAACDSDLSGAEEMRRRIADLMRRTEDECVRAAELRDRERRIVDRALGLSDQLDRLNAVEEWLAAMAARLLEIPWTENDTRWDEIVGSMVLALERIKGTKSTTGGTDRLRDTVKQMELRLAGLRPRVREWEEKSKLPGRVTRQLAAQNSRKGPLRVESAPLL